MSRTQKYKECLSKFIKDKNDLTSAFITDRIKQDDLIFSVVLLTIMNSQNKKNRFSTQGYYAASTLVFIRILTDIIEDSSIYLTKITPLEFTKLVAQLEYTIQKLVQQNLDCLKHTIGATEHIGIILSNTTNIFLDYKSSSIALYNTTYEYETVTNSDIVKWYIKDNEQHMKNYNGLKVYTKDSMKRLISHKLNILSEYAFCLGWVLGGGDYTNMSKVKKLASYFTFIYKLYVDYVNFEQDLATKNPKNYVIVNGLQNSYNEFFNYKQKFIEEALTLDLYTNTLAEIIEDIEHNIDNFLDKTSPDLKSLCSTKTQ